MGFPVTAEEADDSYRALGAGRSSLCSTAFEHSETRADGHAKRFGVGMWSQANGTDLAGIFLGSPFAVVATPTIFVRVFSGPVPTVATLLGFLHRLNRALRSLPSHKDWRAHAFRGGVMIKLETCR